MFLQKFIQPKLSCFIPSTNKTNCTGTIFFRKGGFPVHFYSIDQQPFTLVHRSTDKTQRQRQQITFPLEFLFTNGTKIAPRVENCPNQLGDSMVLRI